MIHFSPPDIQEEDIDAVAAVLRSGWITSGAVAREFEDKIVDYTDAGGAVSLNSCTAALEIALRVLGVGPGDEVIVPAYTYTASAAVIAHVGATMVLVDSQANSYVPSIASIMAAVTERTRAVIVVDLGGVPYDSRGLTTALEHSGRKSANGNELQSALGRPAVIADAAHSLGATVDGRSNVANADFTCFSFHAVKNITSAEGGAIVWRSDLPVDQTTLSSKIRRLSLHGQSKDAFAKLRPGSWEYDIVEFGYKFNMPDTLAALGLAQLKRYDQLLNRRQVIIDHYDRHLSSAVESLDHRGDNFTSSGHLYMLNLGENWRYRDEIIIRMANAGIATNVHYKPLPMHSAYGELGLKIEQFPHAYERYRREISLPLHAGLDDNDLDTIVATLNSVLQQLLETGATKSTPARCGV